MAHAAALKRFPALLFAVVLSFGSAAPLVATETRTAGAAIPPKSAVGYSTERTVTPPAAPAAKGSDWFAEANFGLFIHWGLYAVTEGEWRGKQVPYIGEWIMHEEKIPIAEYSKLARRFNPVHFDAREWVRLAEAAGMRYLVFTAKHHDGFAMFHSKADPYNVVDATPFKRDVLAELAEACRGTQVKLCVYYSHSVDWNERHGGNLPQDIKPNYGNAPNHVFRSWGNDWDFPPGTPEGFAEYMERKVKPQLREILTRYGPIGMIWFDTPTNSLSRERALEINALVKELQPECLVNARIGHGLGDFDVLGDNKMPDSVRIRRSEACITLNDTWGYKAHDQNWKSADTVRKMLAEANARNTNVLLNIGPQPDGRFPAPAIAVLEDLAKDRAEEKGPVPPFDPATVNPALFEGPEHLWAYHLVHLPTVANAVVMDGEHRGFIGIPVWRSQRDNQPYNARVLENHLPLAFFYTADRPWNPYRGHPALRARLEAVLDFWCRSQHTDGRFSEYGPEGWGLPATSFGIKMMGETLRLLDESKRAGGPTINPALHQRTIAAARRSIEGLLTDPSLIAHGKRFSNQYTGFWGGALAFLSVHPDDSLRRRLTERIREVMPGLSSPAGYHYEDHGCDWGYTLGTHRNNVRHVWNYARGTELGDGIVAMDRPWVEWLAYNAVREPDGSYFTLNRALETRTGAGGFVTWEFPPAERIPLARAFGPTLDEHQAELEAGRQHLLETWPDVGSLTGYAPHVFADRLDRHPWYPTAADRAAAVAQLPYLARDRFAHQRVDDRAVSLSLNLTRYDRFAHQRADDRHPMSSTFVRRPSYYAAFNAGAKVTAMQRYGLGLLWSPKMGTVLQTQSRDAAPWGTAPAGGVVFEASPFQPTLRVGGQLRAIEPGAKNLPGGETEEVVFTYSLATSGLKTVTFASDHVAVRAVHPGVFTEHLPLLMRPDDELVIAAASVRLRRGDHTLEVAFKPGVQVETTPTEVRHGPFRVVQLKLTAVEMLDYRLAFQTENVLTKGRTAVGR